MILRSSGSTLLAAALAGAVLGFAGCGKEPSLDFGGELETPVLPATPYTYTLPVLPAHLNSTLLQFWESTPDDNPITDAGATLGRVLFHDRALSANFTTSCSSCHVQEHGFADPQATSLGHTGDRTRRNASHLVNQFFTRRQFWDERAPNLEAQVLMPVQDPVEMGMSLQTLGMRLGTLSYYPPLFEAAFGDPDITSDRVSRALAQFVRSMASYRTRYDEGEANGFTDFTPLELAGKDLFFSGQARCNHCHMTANFHNLEARNNGLDASFADNGLGDFTGDPEDNGKFKVPSLRNVELTAPYMHDGRFHTLEEVIEHYNSGVQQSPTLDDRLTVELMTGGTPAQLGLTPYQKQALVAFLKTLTDVPLVTDERFSDPFAP